MSSPTYSTELTPEPRLRRLVIGSGVAATLAGLVMILTLPVAPHLRAIAAPLWLLINLRQLVTIREGQRRCRRLRIEHDGRIRISAPDGCCMTATLRAGSLVLKRFAWLRFRSDDGRQFAEFVRRKSPRDEQWRRLQVIWRHLGAGA